jgi:hypothetical protein
MPCQQVRQPATESPSAGTANSGRRQRTAKEISGSKQQSGPDADSISDSVSVSAPVPVPVSGSGSGSGSERRGPFQHRDVRSRSCGLLARRMAPPSAAQRRDVHRQTVFEIDTAALGPVGDANGGLSGRPGTRSFCALPVGARSDDLFSKLRGWGQNVGPSTPVQRADLRDGQHSSWDGTCPVHICTWARGIKGFLKTEELKWPSLSGGDEPAGEAVVPVGRECHSFGKLPTAGFYGLWTLIGKSGTPRGMPCQQARLPASSLGLGLCRGRGRPRYKTPRHHHPPTKKPGPKPGF